MIVQQQNHAVVLQVLVANSDRSSRAALAAIIQSMNIQPVLMEHGAQALEYFRESMPDLVIMDAVMPIMDGYEATRQIKRACGNTFVPVVIITARGNDSTLRAAIDAGADDFITTPYSVEAIKARIQALLRIRDMHEVLRRLQQQQQHELRLAEHLFTNILARNTQQIPGISCWQCAATQFSGDIFLARQGPGGIQQFLLADFTGHGLAAAIGALPVADLFVAMSEKGFSIGDIAVEINRKLLRILPRNMYCAACLLEFDEKRTSVSVWNGGMPTAYVLDKNGTIRHRFAACHPPLGVLDTDRFDRSIDILSLHNEESLLLYSDGIVRTQDSHGKKLGQTGLETLLNQHPTAGQAFLALREATLSCLAGRAPDDDLSLIELRMGVFTPETTGLPVSKEHIRPTGSFDVAVTLDATTLRLCNPVPQLLNLLSEFQGAPSHRGRVFTLLSELFANALDHGLLELDSSIKQRKDGFAEYYREKVTRLAALTTGWIRITLEHRNDNGQRLIINITDSGTGFNHNTTQSSLEGNTLYSGRGMALLHSLCESVQYHGNGNHAEVVYRYE